MSVKNTKSCRVWSRFHGTRKDKSVVKLRIQDLEWGKHKDDVIDFILKNFVKYEAFHKAAGISNNEDAKTEYKELLYLLYDKQQPLITVCYIDNDDSQSQDIVGMSITSNKQCQSDDDNLKDFIPKTKEVQNLFKIFKISKYNKASKGYDSFYEGRGISVHPDHRNLGIAYEFVRLRKQICIDNNVQITSAWMTALGTQKAAAKYNWKTFMELPVEELTRQTGLTFATDVPTFKLMYTTKD